MAYNLSAEAVGTAGAMSCFSRNNAGKKKNQHRGKLRLKTESDECLYEATKCTSVCDSI